MQEVDELLVVGHRAEFLQDQGLGPGRENSVHVVVAVQGQTDLLEIVLTLDAVGRFAHLLHGGHEQGDQHGDDGDDHQQLDQGESAASVLGVLPHADLSTKADEFCE